MPELGFTYQQVEAAAGVKPWTRRQKFSAEIKPDDMADTAAAYARAAAEGVSARELAQRATEVAAGAGELDGESLVDADGRIDETDRALQFGRDGAWGEAGRVGQAVDLLVSAMNRAIDAEERVSRLVLAADGLEARRSRHVTDAVNEWNGWQDALGEAVYRTGTWRYEQPPETLTVTYGGRQWQAERRAADGGVTYALPDSLARDIRGRHLAKAVKDAEETDKDISEEITAYRARLSGYAEELGGEGYSLVAGPLGLFTSEEMARYAAAEIAGLLKQWKEDGIPPDGVALERLTYVVGDMYGELGPEDIAYLEAFFRSLSAEQLAWLGSLEGAYASVLTPTAEQTIKDNIGRGMTALLDPARGGIDPVTERDRVPAGIRHYVYDYRDVLKDGDAEAFLRDLDGFAQLIDGRPGDWFAHDLARAALDHQLLADGLAAVGALDRPHTGSGDLLFAASGNDTIAAHLLNDRSFRETLLTLDWGGKTEADNGWLEPIGQPGPMAFIRNGTRLPYDVDPESPLGQSHLDAAYAVLDYADRNRDAVSARHGDYDESFVKLAVGELAWDYTIPSGPERFDRFGELSSWKDIPPYEGAYEE